MTENDQLGQWQLHFSSMEVSEGASSIFFLQSMVGNHNTSHIHHAARRRMFSELFECGVTNASIKSILRIKDYKSSKVIINFLHMTGLYTRSVKWSI